MPVAVAVSAFLAGALVSLATSWVLVTRLERVGERLGLSEALLGIVAALAADAPEVTSAVTAMASHQQRLGAGVVIGSNVFNLAALLGLGAVVAGRIRLHRKVVVLGGAVAMCVASVCLAVALGFLAPGAGLVLALATVAVYAVVLGASERGLARLRLPGPWIAWLRSAVTEEEAELEDAIRPERGRRQDVIIAALSLLVVIAASVTMERAAAALGNRFAIPEIVVGGLVLAAVTSLPNAVAAVYLAARGRGAATLSTALNSNNLNVTIGLLVPAALIGLGLANQSDDAHRDVVHRAHRRGAGVRLPRPRHPPVRRRPDHRRLRRLRRVTARVGLRSGTRFPDRDRGRHRGDSHSRCPPGTRPPPRSRRARDHPRTRATRQRTSRPGE